MRQLRFLTHNSSLINQSLTSKLQCLVRMGDASHLRVSGYFKNSTDNVTAKKEFIIKLKVHLTGFVTNPAQEDQLTAFRTK